MPDSSSTPEYSREYMFDSLTLYLTPDGKFRFFIDNAVQPETSFNQNFVQPKLRSTQTSFNPNIVQPKLRSTGTSFNRKHRSTGNIVQPDLQSGCLFIFRQIANLPVRESAGTSTRTAAYENLPVRLRRLPESLPCGRFRTEMKIFFGKRNLFYTFAV